MSIDRILIIMIVFYVIYLQNCITKIEKDSVESFQAQQSTPDVQSLNNLTSLADNIISSDNRTLSLPFNTITTGDRTSLSFLPVGSIIMYFSTSVSTLPDGWVLCNGNQVNGVQTPDLRGRFPIGTGAANSNNTNDQNQFGGNSAGYSNTTFSRGHKGGKVNHTLGENEMPEHNHDYQDIYYSTDISGQYGTSLGSGSDVDRNNKTWEITRTTRNKGSSQAHNNMPPYIALDFYMRVY